MGNALSTSSSVQEHAVNAMQPLYRHICSSSPVVTCSLQCTNSTQGKSKRTSGFRKENPSKSQKLGWENGLVETPTIQKEREDHFGRGRASLFGANSLLAELQEEPDTALEHRNIEKSSYMEHCCVCLSLSNRCS